MPRNLVFHLIYSWLWMFLSIFPLNGDCFLDTNPCRSKSTCGECIQTPTCAWCFQPPETFRGIDRCYQPTDSSSFGLCPEEYIYNPMNAVTYLSRLQPFRQLYLSPQKIKAELRVDSSMYIIQLNAGVDGPHTPLSIEVTDNSTDYVDIVYYSKCSDEAGPEIPTNKCTDVNGQIQFKIGMKLKKCPKDPQEFSQIIAISVAGTDVVSTIDLSMLCSCSCENPNSQFYEEYSPRCSGGTYSCGICINKPNVFGSRSGCRADLLREEEGCVSPNSTNGEECSGNGVCICGNCECDSRMNIEETISGRWCECDNFSCDRHDGEICGGHGRCDCKECKCEAPWTGKACECYNATNTCFPPFQENPQLCNGHGDCICGVCQCQVTAEGTYTGRYCERRPTRIDDDTCEELKPCVLCQVYHVGPLDDVNCVMKCGNFHPLVVVQANDENDEFLCVGYDEDNCRYAFAYKKDNETHYSVKAQMERECPP